MNYGTRGFIMAIMRGIMVQNGAAVPSVCRYRLQQYCRRRAGYMVLRVLYFCQQCLYGSEVTSCCQNAAECGRRIELSCDTTCRWVASHCRHSTTKFLSGRTLRSISCARLLHRQATQVSSFTLRCNPILKESIDGLYWIILILNFVKIGYSL